MTYNASVPSADSLVRLHLSESPFGTSPAAVAAVTGELERINRYPSPEREGLVRRLSEHWEVAPEQIAVANGSDELVLATALTLGDRDRPGLVSAGTFPGYPAALERIGRGVVRVPLDGPRVDPAAFAERLPECGIGYVCNPHNPCGTTLPGPELEALAAAARDSGTPLVFDEAYHEFGPADQPQARSLLRDGTPVLALRTFSKAYGLAALRIGYALGPAELIAEVRRTLTVLPFSVNRAAQAAAVAALADREFLDRVRRETARRRGWFCAELDRRGYRWLPSVTNFVAVAVADSGKAQDALARDHGILVRDTGVFGFPGHLRVSLGTEEELLAFLDALDHITAGTR
ncbi:pyridoxal phosphate-dependent aminotransferase [Kitasatospora sp. NPDC002543]